jgi:hypothetical protein
MVSCGAERLDSAHVRRREKRAGTQGVQGLLKLLLHIVSVVSERACCRVAWQLTVHPAESSEGDLIEKRKFAPSRDQNRGTLECQRGIAE